MTYFQASAQQQPAPLMPAAQIGHNGPPTLTADEALSNLILAKQRFARLKQEVEDAEVVLISLIDTRKPDDYGSKTYTVADIKVTVERKNNLSCNKEEQAAMRGAFMADGLPAALLPLVDKTEINESRYKKLKESDPRAYAVAAKFATSKPAKVAVTIAV